MSSEKGKNKLTRILRFQNHIMQRRRFLTQNPELTHPDLTFPGAIKLAKVDRLPFAKLQPAFIQNDLHGSAQQACLDVRR